MTDKAPFCPKCKRKITINICECRHPKEVCYFCHLKKYHLNRKNNDKSDKNSATVNGESVRV